MGKYDTQSLVCGNHDVHYENVKAASRKRLYAGQVYIA
jgi:hypothetical protein